MGKISMQLIIHQKIQRQRLLAEEDRRGLAENEDFEDGLEDNGKIVTKENMNQRLQAQKVKFHERLAYFARHGKQDEILELLEKN